MNLLFFCAHYLAFRLLPLLRIQNQDIRNYAKEKIQEQNKATVLNLLNLISRDADDFICSVYEDFVFEVEIKQLDEWHSILSWIKIKGLLGNKIINKIIVRQENFFSPISLLECHLRK